MCKLGLCKCDQAKTRPARLLATAMMTGMDMVGQSIGQLDHVFLYTMLVWEGESRGWGIFAAWKCSLPVEAVRHQTLKRR